MEVKISRRGDEDDLRGNPGEMARAFELLADLPDDVFAESRKDPRPQRRGCPGAQDDPRSLESRMDDSELH